MVSGCRVWVSCVAVMPALVCMAAAQPYVIPEETMSYIDANGVYTIIGNVKNGPDGAASVVLTLTIHDNGLVHTKTVLHGAIPAGSELPFKVKMPGISADAILMEPAVRPVRAWMAPLPIEVIYDQTLVIHPDGHLSGYVTNTGEHPIENPVIWAVVHGSEGPLDVARNMHEIGVVAPGQRVPFLMYPDPAISENITYYSCFAPSDNSVFTIQADRNGQQYDLRYESGAWLYGPVFSADGAEVSIQSTNSYPFETFANLEIPPVTRNESFMVYLDGDQTEFIQSIDEMGMWHLAFNIPKYSQPVITVRGFEDGPLLPVLVPPYLKYDAARWAAGLDSDDVILEDLRLLADYSMIPAGYEGDPFLPDWLGYVMGWYGAGHISDGQFLAAISYMVERGVIRLG